MGNAVHSIVHALGSVTATFLFPIYTAFFEAFAGEAQQYKPKTVKEEDE